ncbi:MAG: alpha-amylase family protein [Fimbriimonadaceae bacterium]
MPFPIHFLGFPDRVSAKTAGGEVALTKTAHGGSWAGDGVAIRVHEGLRNEIHVDVEEASGPIFDVNLVWNDIGMDLCVLGDAWERAYGDLGWTMADGSRGPAISPWYFFGQPRHVMVGDPFLLLVGVKTGGAAMTSWSIEQASVRLKLDIQSGNRPLRLAAGKQLRAATYCTQRLGYGMAERHSALHALCDRPRLAQAPIYGVNDWYYAYGNNSAARILDDSKRAADSSGGLHNRPFSVIDMGWAATEATWSHGNSKFPDMPGLAHDISRAGCKPGLWVRPLQSDEKLPAEWFMAPKILDPSRPDVLEKVHETIYGIHSWGYELIKHDFSTFDVCGLWGFEMTDGVVGKDRTFHDDTRTTAEILRSLYKTIRDAAGSSLVLGCNTVGHLAAGLEEAQRIGDDTSGREWARTVKMGVNSLAYRGIQQGAFFEADPDCVGITTQVPWAKTKQWLELAAGSGTVLFVSAQSEAVGPEQERALRAAFAEASVRQPLATPIMNEFQAGAAQNSLTPTEWEIRGHKQTFDWS